MKLIVSLTWLNHWKTPILILTMIISGLTGFMLPSTPASQDFNRLEKMGFSTLPGGRVQINLDFANAIATPENFATDNPARIVLDFPSAAIGLDKKSQAIGVGVVQGATMVETPDRTRVVFNLVHMAPFNISTVGNRVFLVVDNIGSQTTAPARGDVVDTVVAQAPTTAAPSTPAPVMTPASTPEPVMTSQAARPPEPVMTNPPAPTGKPSSSPKTVKTSTTESKLQSLAALPEGFYIRDVEFRRTAEGAGRVVVDLSDPSIVVNMNQEGENIVLEFIDTNLPERLDRRLDVIDFATPISIVDTFPQGKNVRMNITTKGDYEHLSYQSENTYVVEVKKVAEITPETVKKKEPTYSGQKISFDFQNIDVRSALLLLTDVVPGLNLNIITSPGVTGKVGLRLKNVPWDQALDIILESNGLGMKKMGNVVMVDTKKNIAEREQAELRAMKEIKELEPVRTEFMQINYAKAKDIVDLLQASDKRRSFLSDRGSVSKDDRTNTLIIQDTAERLSDIRNLINWLDRPARQVLIESRIVIATDDFSKSLGVRFGYSGNQDLGHGNGIIMGGKVAGNTAFNGGTAFTSTNTASGGQPGGGENFIINLPETLGGASSAAVGLAIGKIGSYLLQLELSALQDEGRGEVISSPRIITGNQQKASILQGQQIPYLPAAGVGATASVQFVDAVLKLEVTPQITPDDRIIMDLLVSKDEAGVATAGGQPPINKRQVQTQVLVDNGETIVLGGVYEQNRNHTMRRVPFLSDIPLLGNLFKRNFDSERKSELLIFVTPKIIKESAAES